MLPTVIAVKPDADTSTQLAIVVNPEEVTEEDQPDAVEWIPEAEMWTKLSIPSKEALRKHRSRGTLPKNVECRKVGRYWEYRFV